MDRAQRASLHRVGLSRGCHVVEAGRGDPVEWEAFAMAQRRADGAVVLAIYAQELRDAGWPAASGGAAFDLLLRAEQADEDVTAIVGIWYPSSDNYVVFKHNRAKGRAPELAARATFTGTEAARHGYTEVVEVEEHDDVVRVRFQRGGPRR